MIPLQVLGRSFRLIFAEPLETLRVIGPGMISVGLAGMALLVIIGFIWVSEPRISTSTVLLGLLGIVVAGVLVVGMAIFAIFWHRHALLEGGDRGAVMQVSRAIVGQYLLGALLVFLAIFAAAFIAAMFLGLFAAVSEHQSFETANTQVILQLVINIGLSWLALRISLGLPAAALGHECGVERSWEITRPVSTDLLWTAVLLGVLNIILATVFGGLGAALPGPAVVFDVVMIALSSLIYVSVLSTLYGYLVQGRALS